MCACVCVCPHPRLSITSGVIWTLCDWLNKFYSFCMAAIVGFVSICVLRIDAHCENKPKKCKLALYKLSIHFSSSLKGQCIGIEAMQSHMISLPVKLLTKLNILSMHANSLH